MVLGILRKFCCSLIFHWNSFNDFSKDGKWSTMKLSLCGCWISLWCQLFNLICTFVFQRIWEIWRLLSWTTLFPDGLFCGFSIHIHFVKVIRKQSSECWVPVCLLCSVPSQIILGLQCETCTSNMYIKGFFPLRGVSEE